MTKEELIISLLKSKQSIAELFNNNLYDNRISDIRRILNRLRDLVPRKYKKEIKGKLYEIEHQENLSEENDEYLRKLVRILNDKEKHSPYDRDDLDYYGIKNIENLFDEASEEDYYKPILVKSSFKSNYKYYEIRGGKEKRLSVKQYLNKITSHLYDLINDHRIARRVWKIQISMRVNFISSKDTGETRTIYVWSNNESIMRGSDTDDIIRELFRSFLHNYQEELKIIKGSDFVFESVQLMDYKLHRVRLRRGGSYVKSPEWLANKKATINPKNKNDYECLRWSIISALNYNEIMKKEFENIFKKIKHEDKDFSSHRRDWENFEQNTESIAFNVLLASQNMEEITLVYKSEHNYNRENKVLWLMINDEKYYYFAVKDKLELHLSEWLGSKKE